MLFSIDYPYEDSAVAGKFLDDAPLDNVTRAKVAHFNAIKLMNVKV